MRHKTVDVSIAKPDEGSLEMTEELIRIRAYRFYEERGCEQGHDLEDWLRAEAEVLGEKPASAPEAKKRKARAGQRERKESDPACGIPESVETQVMPKSLNVECPACGAKVGEPCKTLTGKAMPDSHTKRKNAALAKKYPSEAVKKVSGRIASEAKKGK